jgi:hypothetical protein
MNRTVLIVLLFAAIFTRASLAQPVTYMFLTDEEQTRLFNGRIAYGGDTIDGPMHSNSQIDIEGDPVFTDQVSTTEPNFFHGAGYNPHFDGPAPHFRAPSIPIPAELTRLREHAGTQGHHFMHGDYTYRLVLVQGTVHVSSWPTGTTPDTATYVSYSVVGTTCMFFDGVVEVKGTLRGTLLIGSAKLIRIIDNVKYSDYNAATHRVPATSTNYLVLASEGEVKIANTDANGRGNSDGLGTAQPMDGLTDVIINSMVCALGESFTFEQQNDPDSGYCCVVPCGCNPGGIGGGPDNRGTVYLYGAITQARHGYLHRAQCTSTGYTTEYRYDPRLRTFDTMTDDDPGVPSTDSLNFGGVPIGTTATDTVIVGFWESHNLGTVTATGGFDATRVAPLVANRFAIPVTFTPTLRRGYTGTLTVHAGTHVFNIHLLGGGVTAASADDPSTFHPSSFSLSAFPNPFNQTTTLRFSLSRASDARIIIYDLTGRTVKTFELSSAVAGEHTTQFDAAGIASGVYFACLRAGNQTAMQKLLLLK